MSDDPAEQEEPAGEVIAAVEGGTRIFWIAAPSMSDLVARLALVLGEHMHDDDELHITYNAMQNGWVEHEPQPRRMTKAPTRGWTEIHFEYSAFVVLREPAPLPASEPSA